MSNHTETTEEAVSALRRYADTVRDSGGAITVSLDALREYADMIESSEMREREQKRKLYSEIIARLEDKLAESVRKNELLRAENIQLANDVEKANRKIERLSGNIASELKSALIEILDRTNREKARDYDAALNGGILENHDIANTAINQIKGE